MLNLEQPFLALRDKRCDCCNGQGALGFMACPDCGYVLLVCDEVGSVIPDPRNLARGTYGGEDDPACVCPKCKRVPAAQFRHATEAEVQQTGFQSSEYVRYTPKPAA
jgi:hypothetical protein